MPFIQIGFKHHREKMGHLDVAIERPNEGEFVSAFSFMSVSLSKDPALTDALSSVQVLLSQIKASLVIKPTADYRRAVEAIYLYL